MTHAMIPSKPPTKPFVPRPAHLDSTPRVPGASPSTESK